MECSPHGAVERRAWKDGQRWAHTERCVGGLVITLPLLFLIECGQRSARKVQVKLQCPHAHSVQLKHCVCNGVRRVAAP